MIYHDDDNNDNKDNNSNYKINDNDAHEDNNDTFNQIPKYAIYLPSSQTLLLLLLSSLLIIDSDILHLNCYSSYFHYSVFLLRHNAIFYKQPTFNSMNFKPASQLGQMQVGFLKYYSYY